jgi:6-phosphogluconolactonase/glucosamine-6-phosphate isomerase/deaminase
MSPYIQRATGYRQIGNILLSDYVELYVSGGNLCEPMYEELRTRSPPDKLQWCNVIQKIDTKKSH